MALILVVDDSSFARRATCGILAAEGFGTVEGGDADECFERLATHKPDCILLDLIMPGKGGLEVLKELKEKGDDTPVVVFTSETDEAKIKECIDAGASGVVNKPPSAAKLKTAINGAIKGRGGE